MGAQGADGGEPEEVAVLVDEEGGAAVRAEGVGGVCGGVAMVALAEQVGDAWGVGRTGPELAGGGARDDGIGADSGAFYEGLQGLI